MAIDRSKGRQADAGYSYGQSAPKGAPSKPSGKGDRVGKGAFTSSPAKKDERSFFDKVDGMVPSIAGLTIADNLFATTNEIRTARMRKENMIKAKGLKNAAIDKAIQTRAQPSLGRRDRMNRGQR